MMRNLWKEVKVYAARQSWPPRCAESKKQHQTPRGVPCGLPASDRPASCGVKLPGIDAPSLRAFSPLVAKRNRRQALIRLCRHCRIPLCRFGQVDRVLRCVHVRVDERSLLGPHLYCHTKPCLQHPSPVLVVRSLCKAPFADIFTNVREHGAAANSQSLMAELDRSAEG
jgi:hypothetical protein